jgi:hypothetical protein
MADQPSSPERDGSADRGPTAGPPRWVKVAGIIALAFVVLVLIVLLAGGNHGPNRHQSCARVPQLIRVLGYGWC